MKRDKVKQLEWFRTFVYADLDAIGRLEKSDLMSWLRVQSMYPIFEPTKKARLTGAGTMAMPEHTLLDTRAWFADQFHKILESIQRAGDSEIKEWSPDENLFEGFAFIPPGQKQILEPFGIDLLPGKPVPVEIAPSAMLAVEPVYKEEDGKAYAKWDPKWKDTAEVRVSTTDLGMKMGLLFSFLRAINGLPPSAFRKCEGCGQWYFHITKRERKYCNDKCTKKMFAREKREKERNAKKKK